MKLRVVFTIELTELQAKRAIEIAECVGFAIGDSTPRETLKRYFENYGELGLVKINDSLHENPGEFDSYRR